MMRLLFSTRDDDIDECYSRDIERLRAIRAYARRHGRQLHAKCFIFGISPILFYASLAGTSKALSIRP